MSIPFDPYHKWLGIPPAEQPPNYYRLLGISLFESDTDVIEVAADQRMAILRSFQAGPHSDLTQKLLNEVTAAKLCLLKAERRAKYDATLRRPVAPVREPEPEPVRRDETAPSELLAPLEKSPPGRIPVARLAPEQSSRVESERPAVATKPIAAKAILLSANPAAAATNLTPKNPPIARQAEADTAATPLRLNPPIVPRSAAWDQVVAEACAAATTVLPRRRKGWLRWRPSPQLVQFAVGAIVLGGMAYGGLFGFDAWQDAEFKRGSHPGSASATGGATPADSAIAASSTGNSPSSNNVSPSRPSRVAASGSNFGDATSGASHFGLADNSGQPSEFPLGPRVPVQPLTLPTVRPGSTAPVVSRSPAPTAQEIQKSGQDLRELLKTDYQQAKGVAGQVALAHKLAGLANTTNDDPVMRYVMASQALDLAVKHCDMQLASGLVYGLRTYYEVDGWSMRSKSLVQLARAARTAAARAEIAKAAHDLVEQALNDDRPDCAFELATLSMNLAGGLKDYPLREQARLLAERSKRGKRAFDAMKAANERLSADPADADANLVVGRFKSLIKQDWTGGLTYLAKSNDPQLRDAVAGEAKPPLEPADEMKLADMWWDLAERHNELLHDDSRDDAETGAMRDRAVYWYRLAMPSLDGVSLVKAKQRVEAQ